MKIVALNKDFIDGFTDGYIQALLWCSVVIIDGEWTNADNFELSTAGADKCRADCLAFCNANARLLDLATNGYRGYDASQAGHDFALTRNGHGSGYWDSVIPKRVREALTAAAQACGEIHLYENDGEIEIS